MEPLFRLAIAGTLAFAVIAVAWLLKTLHQRRRNRDWAPPVALLHVEDVPDVERFPLTFVLFTSPLCSDCREVPGVALDAAPEVPLVTLDVQRAPAAARRYAVPETPTLLLVDDHRRIRYAHVGVPDPDELWLYVREAWDSTSTARTRAGLAAEAGRARKA